MKINILFRKHCRDLQVKLFYVLGSYSLTFIICLKYKVNLFYYISTPFILLGKTFIFTQLGSGFWSYLSLIIWASILFTTPLLLYFCIIFILKSLFNFQVKIIFGATVFLFTLLFNTLRWALKGLLPLILNFFANFENHTGPLLITLEARLDQYLEFFFYFLFCTLMLILIPLIILFLLSATVSFYNKNKLRRYLYSCTLIFFMAIAPPDFFFQAIFFCIFTLFVEVFLLLFQIGVFYLKTINNTL